MFTGGNKPLTSIQMDFCIWRCRWSVVVVKVLTHFCFAFWEREAPPAIGFLQRRRRHTRTPRGGSQTPLHHSSTSILRTGQISHEARWTKYCLFHFISPSRPQTSSCCLAAPQMWEKCHRHLYEPNIITFARVLWANICFSCTTFQREMFFWDGWSLLVGHLTVASVLFLIAVCKVIYLFNEFIHFP